MSNLLPPGFLFWDGVKYVVISTGPSGGPAGGDLAGSYPSPLVAKINGVTITGVPSSGESIVATGPTSAAWQTVAAGNTFVYQQGGTPSGNVYASWTALMAARALIHGPAVIAIDNSITPKPTIDPGAWNLTNNTVIIGNSYGPIGSSQSTILAIGGVSDAQLLNAVWFQDIVILGSNTTLPCIDTSAGKSVAFDCYNTSFLNSGTPALINAINATAITLNGSSSFGSGVCLGGAIATTCALIIDDISSVQSNTILTTGTLNISINGITASCSNTQPGSSGFNFVSGNFSGSANPFNTAANGTVLTKTGTNQADWLAPGSSTVLWTEYNASTALSQAKVQWVLLNGTTAGSVPLNLTFPTTPNDGDEIFLALAFLSAGVVVTLIAGGATTLDDVSGNGPEASTVPLPLNGMGGHWKYKAFEGNWFLVTNTYPFTPAVNVENNSVTIANNPHKTLNLIGMGAVDSGSGVATITQGTAPDNAAGRRISAGVQSRMRRNETGQLPINNGPPTIPNLTDFSFALAGRAITTVGDKLLFTGYDGTNQHALYGVDLRTSPYNTSLTNSSTPLTTYAANTPRVLIGVRAQASGVNRDFVYAVMSDSAPFFIELGYITGPFPYTYTQVYHTLTPEGPLFSCELPAGNTAGPTFAYSAGSSRIFIIDPTGTTHLAYTGTNNFGSMCVDDQGFLWVLNSDFASNNNIMQFSVNYSTFTLTLVQTIAYGNLFTGSRLFQICCDGRFIRGVTVVGGTQHIAAFDTLTGLEGPGPFDTGISSSFGTVSQTALLWDGEALWLGAATTTTAICQRMHPMTGEVLFKVPGIASDGVRYATLDDAGVYYVAAYPSGGPLAIFTAASGYPTGNFDSIRYLNRPLAYEIGGRKQNSVVVPTGGSITLDLTHQIVRCQPSAAGCTVNLPASATLTALAVPEWEVLVIDETATSGTHNITVSGNGANLETPGTPGTYASSTTISTNSQAVTWMWNGTQWKIVSIFP